jgi:large subunit ribosomal protein L13
MLADSLKDSNEDFFCKACRRSPWLVVIDAADKHLGHVAVKAANLLRGKGGNLHPACGYGRFVVVINAEKVRVGGKKDVQKSYMSFSGYVGGHKSESFAAPRAHPELLVGALSAA